MWLILLLKIIGWTGLVLGTLATGWELLYDTNPRYPNAWIELMAAGLGVWAFFVWLGGRIEKANRLQ